MPNRNAVRSGILTWHLFFEGVAVVAEPHAPFAESAKLEATIRANPKGLNFLPRIRTLTSAGNNDSKTLTLPLSCRAWRAKGPHTARSDEDLAVSGIDDPLRAEALAAELDELPLPYRFEVQSFAQISHRPLREHIERVGIPLYPEAVIPA